MRRKGPTPTKPRLMSQIPTSKTPKSQKLRTRSRLRTKKRIIFPFRLRFSWRPHRSPRSPRNPAAIRAIPPRLMRIRRESQRRHPTSTMRIMTTHRRHIDGAGVAVAGARKTSTSRRNLETPKTTTRTTSRKMSVGRRRSGRKRTARRASRGIRKTTSTTASNARTRTRRGVPRATTPRATVMAPARGNRSRRSPMSPPRSRALHVLRPRGSVAKKTSATNTRPSARLSSRRAGMPFTAG